MNLTTDRSQGVSIVRVNEARLMYPLLEKRPNVFFDLSRFADYGIVEEIVAKFGAGRLLFGSGMPFLNPGAAITYVCYAEIAEKDKRMILSGNWERMEKAIRL
jgi:predicted TIM-barrel fold metal-dependent hydrolase